MKIQAVDYRDENAAELFTSSLKETGFGVLANHPISKEKVTVIYDLAQSFFDSGVKDDFLFTKGAHDGFFPSTVSEIAKGNTVKDLKEYFHYYPWGKCPIHLKAILQDYYDAANRLATELLGWVEHFAPEDIKVGLSEPLSDMILKSQQTLLRILHYPPLKGDEEPSAIRAAAHEDINFLTILPAANEPGLQVLNKTGDWIDVPCDFGLLIVNIGDMLQEATNGFYPSTTHRVINPVDVKNNQSRISLPLFLHPRPDVVLSNKYTADRYLKERLREMGIS